MLDINGYFVPVSCNTGLALYTITPCRISGSRTADKTDLAVDINAYFAAATTSGLHLYTVARCRVFDSRYTANGLSTAVVVNAMVVPQQPLAFLSVWPAASVQPDVSTLNADDVAIASNMATIPVSGTGQVSACASGTTHLILDASGYFAL